MKVEMFTATDEMDYRDALVILIDGKVEFSAFDGESEDNSLCRNFGDCFSIPDLMQQAYMAGADKEELKIEQNKIDWAEICELF